MYFLFYYDGCFLLGVALAVLPLDLVDFAFDVLDDDLDSVYPLCVLLLILRLPHSSVQVVVDSLLTVRRNHKG